MSKNKWLLTIFLLCIITFILYELLKPDHTASKSGGFGKIAFVRNENNEGTVILYYSYMVKDTSSADYEGFGNLLPHNKHSGITTAYFFLESHPMPDKLTLEAPHFDTVKYRPVAIYIKNRDGSTSVKTNPFQ